MIQIGVDFGGTKIEAAALDRTGRFLVRARSPNPGSYDEAIRAVCALISDIKAKYGEACTIGVGVPGSISMKTGLMRNANSIYLNGRCFREDLAKALGQDIRLANDANCFALSESFDGAAAAVPVAAAVILGTGCGGGVTVNGQLIEGCNGIAGEWGHLPLPWPATDENPGPLCWCGKRGCLETWISGTGLQRDFFDHCGKDLNCEEIIALFREGEPKAEVAFQRYVDRLARGLAAISGVIDPNVIVLGGGLSNVVELYDLLPGTMAKYLFSDTCSTRITRAKWGDSSGVRGAARLWPTAA